jgi:methionyl-tRNA formyltransferase
VRAVVFAYHEIGFVCLEELFRSRIDVAALVTHENDPDEEIWFRTPRALAEAQGIPVLLVDNLRDPTWTERLRSLAPDYFFSFYYRNMLPGEILSVPKIAAMNLHGSLLPRFRGRCPVNWVLIKGEKRTGVTLHVMEEKPDAGDIIGRREVDITFEDTAYTLARKLAEASRGLMRETIPFLESASFERRSQTGVSSYYGGRRPEDGLIDWTKGAEEIYNLTRAVTHPYPGAFTLLGGKKLFIWRALPEAGSIGGQAGRIVSTRPLLVGTGKGLLRILSLQAEGGREVDPRTFAATYNLENGSLGGIL